MQVRVGFAFRQDAFEIVLASQPEQSLAICVDVVAVQEPLALIVHNCMKPELAVDQGQILKVVSVPKSAAFLFTIRGCVFVSKNVERIERRIGTPP